MSNDPFGMGVNHRQVSVWTIAWGVFWGQILLILLGVAVAFFLGVFSQIAQWRLSYQQQQIQRARESEAIRETLQQEIDRTQRKLDEQK